jgi:hypothetical protein
VNINHKVWSFDVFLALDVDAPDLIIQMYSLLQVLPTVIKLFASSDRAIRVGLLQHIESFGGGLSTQVVDEQVSYPTYVHQHTRLA